MWRSVQFGVIASCALIAVGCSSAGDATKPGTAAPPAPTTTTSPPEPVVSPTLLDVGKYPTVPRAPLGTAGDPALGAVVDAQHLADFVVGPWDVDATLVTPYLNAYYLINTPSVLQQLGPEGMAAAAGQHGLVNGFASTRQGTDKSAMINAVLRFPDPAAAAAASADMAAAAATQAVKGIVPTIVAVPGHPDATASTYPFTPHGSDQARATVRAFTPHGPYVLTQFVQSVDGLDPATALVAKTIDAQLPAIDKFRAADPAALGAVPLDPTGLLARTIPAAAANAAKNAVYATAGAEHFQSNPIGSEGLFKDTGVTEVAMGDTNVYQAKDELSARKITDSFSDEISTTGTSADPVKGLPRSRCWGLPAGFYCVAPAGRYAIEATGEQLLDLQQRVAAQYVMLTVT